MTTFGESCIIGMLLGEFKGILLCIFAVEAYTASWIEICPTCGRGGCGLVEAYTASWIEIYWSVAIQLPFPSRLIQPRGLKWCSVCGVGFRSGRGLYSLVD